MSPFLYEDDWYQRANRGGPALYPYTVRMMKEMEIC